MNFIQTLTTLTVSAILILVTTPASATEPFVCDPAQDPDECGCPADLQAAGLDDCDETSFASLPSAWDATDLAPYVSATWNAGGQYWSVEIAAETMPAGGVMILNSAAGQWSDIADLEDFFSDLFGATVTMPSDATSVQLLPDMKIEQRGATHRWDGVSGEWAPANSHNLIWDAITNVDGEIKIGGSSWVELFPDDDCPGTDANSYDSGTDGTLAAEQCSDAQHETYISFLEADPACNSYPTPCDVVTVSAQTSLNTMSTTYFGESLFCMNSSGGPTCDVTNGWITNKRVEADKLTIDNYYFNSQSFSHGKSLSEEDRMDLVLGEVGPNGVCAIGEALHDLKSVTLTTQDGAYDDRHLACE